jgi:hypothetical protein
VGVWFFVVAVVVVGMSRVWLGLLGPQLRWGGFCKLCCRVKDRGVTPYAKPPDHCTHTLPPPSPPQAKDRTLVAQRMSEHVHSDGTTPLLIFPEGEGVSKHSDCSVVGWGGDSLAAWTPTWAAGCVLA